MTVQILQYQTEHHFRLNVTEASLIYCLFAAIIALFPSVVYARTSMIKLLRVFQICGPPRGGVVGISLHCRYDRIEKERFMMALALPCKNGREILLRYGDQEGAGKIRLKDTHIIEILDCCINKLRGRYIQ